MSLIEKNIIDKIEIIDMKNIQVRKANIIEKDGVEIARTFSRTVYSSCDNMIDADQKIKEIGKILWGSIIEK